MCGGVFLTTLGSLGLNPQLICVCSRFGPQWKIPKEVWMMNDGLERLCGGYLLEIWLGKDNIR